MASLFITTRWPDPVNLFTHGTAVRMRLLMRALLQLDPDLDFMILARPAQQDAEAPARIARDIEQLWGIRLRRVVVVPWGTTKHSAASLLHGHLLPALHIPWHPDYSVLGDAGVVRAIRSHLQGSGVDRILAHRIEAMCPLLRAGGPLPPIVFDLDDVEHRAFARGLDLPPHYRAKALLRLQVPALQRLERRAAALAQVTFVCSELDRAYLETCHGSLGFHCVNNALPAQPVRAVSPEPRVLFLGIYSYPPNRVAAEQLVHEIWPLVRQRHRGAVLSIAGRFIERVRGHDQQIPGVEMLGYVESLDDLYATTRVVACPILSGSGTRIKIIEAAMHGRPVVSTSIGAEGLVFDPLRGEIVIADGVQPFADALCTLLDNPEQVCHIADAARKRAMTTYDEDSVVKQAARLMADVGLSAGDS